MNQEAKQVIGFSLVIGICVVLYMALTVTVLIIGSATFCFLMSLLNAYDHYKRKDLNDNHNLYIARLFFVGAIFHAIFPLVGK